MAQTIKASNNESEKKECLNYITDSAESLHEVIHDIGEILQLKKQLNEIKDEVNLEQLVGNIRTIIISDILKQKAVIDCDFSNTPFIYCLRSYLHSIFYNLILNAIKYCKPGIPPYININSKAINNNSIITFTDNGKGIDLAKNGNKLFGLYERFDDKIAGRGLGLFMVKKQVEEMKGTINVNSTAGIGTTFIIEFPILT